MLEITVTEILLNGLGTPPPPVGGLGVSEVGGGGVAGVVGVSAVSPEDAEPPEAGEVEPSDDDSDELPAGDADGATDRLAITGVVSAKVELLDWPETGVLAADIVVRRSINASSEKSPSPAANGLLAMLLVVLAAGAVAAGGVYAVRLSVINAGLCGASDSAGVASARPGPDQNETAPKKPAKTSRKPTTNGV